MVLELVYVYTAIREGLMLWYCTTHYLKKIVPVDVIRETANFVFVRISRYGEPVEKRYSKDSEGESYHPSFKLAKLELIARLSAKLQNARNNVSQLERYVHEANEYPEPAQETKA